MFINDIQKRILITMYNSAVDMGDNPFETTTYIQDLYDWCYPNKEIPEITFWNQLEGLEGMGIIKFASYVSFNGVYLDYIEGLVKNHPVPFHKNNPPGVKYA